MKIYVLIDPRTGEIRYVGATSKTLEQRLYGHLKVRSTGHKGRWVEQLRRQGLSPRVSLVQEVTVACWQEAERYWISYFRSVGCNLTNMTDGGDGVVGYNADVRAKMSAARRKRVTTPETRAKMSASMTGKTHTEEARTKISAAHKGVPLSDAHLEALSVSHRGFKPTDATRAKLRAAKSSMSADTKATMGQAQRVRRAREAAERLAARNTWLETDDQ